MNAIASTLPHFSGDSSLQNVSPAAHARHRLRLALLCLPRCYHLDAFRDGTLIATSESDGKHYLTVWRGIAERPSIHCYFSTAAQREQRIVSVVLAQSQRAADKAARRAERAAPHSLQVGAILMSSWGYEQTNVDFYQVIAVRGKLVDIRKLAQVKEYTSDMTGYAMPVANQFVGEPLIGKRPASSNAVRIQPYSHATAWDGRRVAWSSYA